MPGVADIPDFEEEDEEEQPRGLRLRVADIPDFEDPPGEEPEPARESRWYDPLIAGIEGLSLDSLGKGPAFGAMTKRFAPEREQQVGQIVSEHPIAHAAGQAVTGTGAALAAGPAVGAQALAGGFTSGASTANETRDPAAAGLSALLGGGLGAVGAKAGQWLGSAFGRGVPSQAQVLSREAAQARIAAEEAQLAHLTSPSADPAKEAAIRAARAQRDAARFGADARPAAQLASAESELARVTSPGSESARAAELAGARAKLAAARASAAQQDAPGGWVQALLKAGSYLPGTTGRAARFGHMIGLGGPAQVIPNEGARRFGVAGAQLAGATAGDLFSPPTASAQDSGEQKAYATSATSDWTLKTVLSSGDSGLDEQQQQQLSEALVSGDPRKVSALDYVLRQRSPAYARRVRETFESLNQEESY